ncbi:hypothetical protein [Microvirga roseola]|uniref:hypothetical protein n=1 Tax=Microvirga roseola TaxID=2883126 RepID=UPI001E5D1110|nr:hypothetical protein [Microvirga roseola]
MDTRYSSHPGIKLIRLPRWAAVLAVIAAVSLGLLMLVVAAGLALIIIPVAIVGGMILRWRLRRRMAEAARSGDVIDAEYRIIDRER